MSVDNRATVLAKLRELLPEGWTLVESGTRTASEYRTYVELPVLELKKRYSSDYCTSIYFTSQSGKQYKYNMVPIDELSRLFIQTGDTYLVYVNGAWFVTKIRGLLIPATWPMCNNEQFHASIAHLITPQISDFTKKNASLLKELLVGDAYDSLFDCEFVPLPKIKMELRPVYTPVYD